MIICCIKCAQLFSVLNKNKSRLKSSFIYQFFTTRLVKHMHDEHVKLLPFPLIFAFKLIVNAQCNVDFCIIRSAWLRLKSMMYGDCCTHRFTGHFCIPPKYNKIFIFSYSQRHSLALLIVFFTVMSRNLIIFWKKSIAKL